MRRVDFDVFDEELSDIESFFVDPDFDVVDGDIRIVPALRWASDENAGYAT